MTDDHNQEPKKEMPILTADIAQIRELAALMTEQNLGEIEIREGKSRIRLSRAVSQLPAETPVLTEKGQTPTVPDVSNTTTITAPLVGTAYLGPEPGSQPFAKVGDHINEGQTILIIEAMKVINHIPAPCSGQLMSILVNDGAPVEYGENLAVLAS